MTDRLTDILAGPARFDKIIFALVPRWYGRRFVIVCWSILISIVGVVQLSRGVVQGLSSPHFVYQEDWNERTCEQVLDKVRHRRVDIQLPPDLTGHWVSHRCEIRSGPEYVIRQLRVSRDHKFDSVVYTYSEPDCHHPLFAVHSTGSLTLRQASWTVRGGTEAEYVISSSYLIPYTHSATAAVSGKLGGAGCHHYLTSGHMVPYQRYLIYSSDPSQPDLRSENSNQSNQSEDPNSKPTDNGASCFQALNFTLNELQLVMVELRHRRLHHQHHHRKPHGNKKHHQRNHHIPSHSDLHPQSEASSQNDRQEVVSRHNSGTGLTHRERWKLAGHENFTRKSIDVIVKSSSVNSGSSALDGGQDAEMRSRDLKSSKAKETWDSPELVSRDLLLGAVHSRPQEKLSHRPTSFQTSLKDARTPGCGVCSRIANSSPMYPPRLSTHTGTLLSLEGEWASTRCESRQYGMFLTRRLRFLPDDVTWQGRYDYYHDALCQHPSFSLDAKGSYSGGSDSKLIPRAKDYSFRVTKLKVTPHDGRTADSMNHYSGQGCGKAHAWVAGQEQDVTWTGGCVTLGIRLPNMERDIMRMEVSHRKLHLYVGQRLIDRKPGTAYQMERPTAFQEPLIKCDQHDLDMSINTAPGGHTWVGGIALPLAAGPDTDLDGKPLSERDSAGCCTWSPALLISVLVILWTYSFCPA
ncbi:adenomatosis polyposis coli down-regulated 1 [Plakobranchus ocellatus]|uniref:Adenomatosis polyposis coli down-regulated 1 n=1 Tax=Plakobranchus ocellatus TaxID=259542 RepID=A0AAV3Z687_9GAST|nr:adenomatosis polyposis coli down-regulated 1 [Plakobranchus ocellatus]